MLTEKEISEQYYPLFHGMRSKKTPEQIKKEGFCAYGSPIDEEKNIVDALKYFGKEKLLHSRKRKGALISLLINEVNPRYQDMPYRTNRRNVWASTNKESACEWWSHANPEHVSMALSYAGIEPEEIEKYIKEKFGSNCYNVELKMTSLGTNPNFNTGLNCIPPSLIKKIEECSECKYTGKEHKKKGD